MEFSFSARTEGLAKDLGSFMDEHVYPAEPVFAELLSIIDRSLTVLSVHLRSWLNKLKRRSRQEVNIIQI